MFTIETAGVEAMVRDLATFAGHGANTEMALKITTGKILDTAISYTPISTQAELLARVDEWVNTEFARYDLVSSDGVLTTNQGRRGQLPAGTQWLRENGVNYIMRGGSPRRWSNTRWARYQATAAQRESELKQSLDFAKTRAKASIGMSRQSWVQIGDELDISLHSNRLEKIRAAVASNGIAYQNGRGVLERSDEGLYITVENGYPFGRMNGAGILQRAIDTRLSAFDTDLRKGVFEDLETFGRRYKGLDILLN